MMTVARCWGSISNKAKILFGVLAKKTQSIFILDNGSNYKMNDGPNDKNVFLLEKWGRENYGCTTFMQDITNFIPIHPFIFNTFRNLSVAIQQVFWDSIHWSIHKPVKHMEHFAEIAIGKKITLEILCFFYDFRWYRLIN